MKTFFSPYSLRKRQRLNSLEQSSMLQPGTLIKIVDGEGWGVADLCPRIEMGDDSPENEIKKKGRLYRRSLELAAEDLNARQAKISLLQDKFVKNNFLITDYKTADLNRDIYADHTIKIKADRDVKILSHILNSLVTDIKVRIDFNSILSNEEFEVFLNLLSVRAKNKIEYIEDPTRICNEWKNWNKILPLAFDFQPGEYSAELAMFQIIKPSRQNVPGDLSHVTLTSAMDHPVGVAHGLRIAQKSARSDSGFLTLDLFENNNFQKYFEQKNNYLNFSSLALCDFGIGMSEELAKINWIEL